VTRQALELPEAFADAAPILRPPSSTDIDRITALCQDPDIQHYTRLPVPYRREDAASFVASALETLLEGRGAHLLVEVDEVVVGCVGASINAADRVGVVGYWTAPEARRRGLTTRAVHKLCRWLLDDVELARLELDAAANNPGSNAVAAALGFRLEGTRRSALLLPAVGDLRQERVDATSWGLLPGELRGPDGREEG
jgi:RimJ/RimL family protein N-acetyltransferase